MGEGPGRLDADHLSQVILHATAPAFLLGAVAGFISILITRATGVLDRLRSLNEITEDDTARVELKSDIPRLRRRERLLSDAIRLALGSGICTTLLLALAFTSAFLGFRHEYGAGLLFIVAVGLLGVSLFRFAQEVKVALHDLEHYR